MKSPPAAVQAELPVIGQRVYALGAPRGLEATLTDGLVSAIRRHAAGQVDFIQTSAPLSTKLLFRRWTLYSFLTEDK